MSDTSPATVQVLHLAMVRARGKLIGLATVEVVLDGVSIVLQGVGGVV